MAKKKKYVRLDYVCVNALNHDAIDRNGDEFEACDAVRYDAELQRLMENENVVKIVRMVKIGKRGYWTVDDVHYPRGNYTLMQGKIRFL